MVFKIKIKNKSLLREATALFSIKVYYLYKPNSNLASTYIQTILFIILKKARMCNAIVVKFY